MAVAVPCATSAFAESIQVSPSAESADVGGTELAQPVTAVTVGVGVIVGVEVSVGVKVSVAVAVGVGVSV